MFVLYRSVRTLISKEKNAFGRGGINIAPCFLRDFLEQIKTEPIFIGQFFSSRDSDELCLHVGRRSMADASNV